MRILFISHEAAGLDLAWRLQQEGHEIKTYIQKKRYKLNYEGLLKEKILSWKTELPWVGKGGLIIFDTVGYGHIQDRLRKAGYRVIGGSKIGDLLEENRKYGQLIFGELGMTTVPSRTFYDLDEAIEFVKVNQRKWVIKQNENLSKDFNYVGSCEGGEDVISTLQRYKKIVPPSKVNFDLQERIEGIEIGVGRYFNGFDWVGPIEFNVEHKSLFPGGLGPKTDEMGTLMWYDDDEDNRLYQETIKRMTNFLRKINFIGDFEINCIVNKEKIFPLEATARFGFPALQLQTALNLSPWGDFLNALASGQEYDLKWKREFGVIVLLAVPPFPYNVLDKKNSLINEELLLDKKFLANYRKNIHFEDVYYKQSSDKYYASNNSGYILHVSAAAEDLNGARNKVYGIIKKITIPKQFYRNDIGKKFIEEESKMLINWKIIKDKQNKK